MKIILSILLFFLFPSYLHAQNIVEGLNNLTNNQQDGLGLIVYDLDTNKTIYAKNEHQALKPASVMKLLTTYAALDSLGSEFTFQTKLYSENRKGSFIENLYIVGGGDPTLTTEQLWLIVRAIKRKRIDTIQNVYLDDTIYKTFNQRSGERAYQTGNSGFPFNFNSIDFELCAKGNNERVDVNIDPWEYKARIFGWIRSLKGSTKGYSIVERNIENSPNVIYQISGDAPFINTCTEVYRSVEDPIKYLTSVLKEYFRILDIKVGTITKKEFKNTNFKELYIHNSKSLKQIIGDMNHFSNNFIAEQIVVALDKNTPKHKLREEGLRTLSKYAKLFSNNEKEFYIVDASGLSHENKLSPFLLLNLLVSAYNNPFLSVDFLSSLPIGGESGTLKTRDIKSLNGVVRAKTGTIDGVSSLAGYVLRKDKKYAFVILQNSGLLPTKKHQFEEKIIKVLFSR